MSDLHHNVAERVLAAIDERGVAPKPRWHFLLREWVVWLVALLAFVLGSIATALTLYIGQASLYIERHIAQSPLGVLFDALPFLWIVLVVVGVFYTVHAVRSTRRGYRLHTSWLVGIAIGVSIGAGWSINAAGLGSALDSYLLAEMPVYRSLTGFAPEHWMDPTAGLVAGVVEEVREDSFTVRGVDGVAVEVTPAPTMVMPPHMELSVGAPVRVVGTTTAEDATFTAEEVRPFRGRGPRMHRMGSGAGDLESGGPRMRDASERSGRSR